MLFSEAQINQINTLSSQTPRAPDVTYAYGTAGFRCKASDLESVCLRMGMLAGVRSRCFPNPLLSQDCHAVGSMLTASHNKEVDNGLKLVDPSGSMLDQSWEALAAQLANAEENHVGKLLNQIAQEMKIDITRQPYVIVGRDTRASSPALCNLFIAGAKVVGASVLDIGIVTTPQLHYVVRATWQGIPASASVEGYYTDICTAFCTLMGDRKAAPVLVDCANGVGRVSAEALSVRLANVLPISTLNTGSENLNNQCGAEYVQSQKKVPLSFDIEQHSGVKCASVDGDADRLVYYYFASDSGFHLLDGDKLIALYTGFLKDLIATSELSLSLGIVQVLKMSLFIPLFHSSCHMSGSCFEFLDFVLFQLQ